MKRFVVSLLLVVSLGAMVFAEGTRETERPYQEGELSTLTGKLDLSGTAPVLQSGGTDYLVMIPRFYDQDIDVADGSTVVLEGYVHTGLGRYANSDQQVISVTKATVNGEVFEFDALGRGAGMGWSDRPADQTYGRGSMGGSRFSRRR